MKGNEELAAPRYQVGQDAEKKDLIFHITRSQQR
jgi:hypothetical protein